MAVDDGHVPIGGIFHPAFVRAVEAGEGPLPSVPAVVPLQVYFLAELLAADVTSEVPGRSGKAVQNILLKTTRGALLYCSSGGGPWLSGYTAGVQ